MENNYVVEESEDFSDESLAKKLNELHARGFVIQQVIEKDSQAGNGYTVVAHLRHLRS